MQRVHRILENNFDGKCVLKFASDWRPTIFKVNVKTIYGFEWNSSAMRV